MDRPPTIAETLLTRMRDGITPNELIQAVRAVHPEATKKEIMHAAFTAVIALAESDPGSAKVLQDFALRNRGAS
jgi:hypothetical protein